MKKNIAEIGLHSALPITNDCFPEEIWNIDRVHGNEQDSCNIRIDNEQVRRRTQRFRERNDTNNENW